MTTYIPVFYDIETTGLNPMQQAWWNSANKDAAVITVAVGTIDNWRSGADGAEYNINVLSINSTEARLFGEERRLLKKLRDYMYNLAGSVEEPSIENPEDKQIFLVGFNSRYFDHQWLGARFARQRLDPWPFVHSRKRLDIKNSLKEFTNRYWKQDDYAEELGLESRDEITGKQVPEMYDKGRMDKVEKHAYWDLKDLMRMFVAEREEHMQYFYDHYGIEREANFRSEVEL